MPDNLNDRIQELENELQELKQLLGTKSTLLQHLLQNSKKDTLFSVIDTKFNLIEINDKRLNQIGKKRSEILGEKCYKVFYGLNKECKECTVRKSIIHKKQSRFLKSYSDNGIIKFEEKIITPIANSIGDIERLTVESEDITGYYQLIDKAGQRDNFFRNIFESSGDAYFIHDEKGKILEFGSQLPVLLGYTEEEFKYLSVHDIDDPKNSKEFDKRLRDFKQGNNLLFETDIIKKSGGRVPVELSANLIPLQDHPIYFIALRNLEKRRKAEEDLRRSEKTFRTLVENAPDLIMRFDREFKHLFVNSASIPLLGIEPQKFIGKTHEDLNFPHELCKFWEQEMQKVFDSSKARTVEFMLPADGKDYYFEWQLIPEFESNGETVTLMAIARDITESKLNEIALKEAIQTKDKFFSIIAHDLKNPFNVMIPIVGVLKEELHSMSKENLSEMVDLISSSVQQEYNLLESLLEWSRAQSGRIKREPKQIDLRIITEANINLHKAKFQEKNISIEFFFNGNNEVFADEYMISTVIRNLISNALKFTHNNGIIKIGIESNQSEIQFYVQDNGVGISTENQKKLFRIDINFNCVGTCEEVGTGIGLILCKEFIEQNKGKIKVDSKIGEGSKFTFTLPA
ncbi:PAS domain S-box protein [Marinifilum sp. RC60d5]|uniref:PAS domain S-box protein n=1 Tax=Marinifilum sp. RC60d5 TaxID=3458414 RepID=UPI0040357D0F